MEKATHKLAQRLLSHIHTTNTLKHISQTLESLTQNRGFKDHANAIVSDPNLTDSQKRTQLLYLIRSADAPLLYDFLSDQLNTNQLWLFNTDKIDYFDRFVQDFQRSTETVNIVHLVTVVPLNESDLKQIADDFAQTFGYKVVLNLELNPNILGGLQLRLENVVFDYSLRTKFHQFEQHWIKSIESTDKAIGRHQPDPLKVPL